ncbi:MAG TPA: hypothetical protein VGD77_07730 [Gemmatimonadaceae bacterium]
MSRVARVLPLAVVAALVAACADLSAPTQVLTAVDAPMASKGSSGGGGGGGGGGGTTLVVTTPPTVDATGAWAGSSDGPDIAHTYTLTLRQTGAGMVSGTGTTATPFMNAAYLVVGTVNGDTLMLYTGSTCASCTLAPLYRGIVSANGSRVDGTFLNGGVSPVTFYRQ